jgi:hypothetical protein
MRKDLLQKEQKQLQQAANRETKETRTTQPPENRPKERMIL